MINLPKVVPHKALTIYYTPKCIIMQLIFNFLQKNLLKSTKLSVIA